jgi:triosephosphate isomerase
MKKGKRIVAANWKMSPDTLQAAKQIFDPIKRSAARFKKVSIIVCPPTPFLSPLRSSYSGKKIVFGAQDIFTESKGAHTGAVTASMMASVGASTIIVGHSERRVSGDTNDEVAKKLRLVFDAGLSAILCIGERERDHSGKYLAFIEEEIKSALSGIDLKTLGRLTIAYEPIFAIGKSADAALKPHDIHEMTLFIRRILSEKYDRDSAFRIPILYGGSVEVANAEGILRDGEVQGFLIGHASLDPAAFKEILSIAESV